MNVSQTHAAFKAADMHIVKEERFVFKTEWYDKQAALIREYLLTYYPADCTAEMVGIFTVHDFLTRFYFGFLVRSQK